MTELKRLKRRRSENWNRTETKILIDLWSAKSVQESLKRVCHTMDIWINLTNRLNEVNGSEREWWQVKEKMRVLLSSYRRAKRRRLSDDSTKERCQFYTEFDSVLGDSMIANEFVEEPKSPFPETAGDGDISSFLEMSITVGNPLSCYSSSSHDGEVVSGTKSTRQSDLNNEAMIFPLVKQDETDNKTTEICDDSNSTEHQLNIGDDSLPCIRWLQQKGLLRQLPPCFCCKKQMHWTRYSKCLDGFVWKCQTKGCQRHKGTTSIKTGSFFAQSRLPFKTWIHLMYLWCSNIGPKAASPELGISAHTIIDCYCLFRELCDFYFKRNPIILGGPDKLLQIDESCFSSKRNADSSNIWVLGIIDPTTNPTQGYMEILETRDIVTIFPILQKVVKPGTVICSRQWQAYQGFQESLELVTPLFQFKDSDMKVKTQTMHLYWYRHKLKIKAMLGCRHNFLESYLMEFMWRERFPNNTFEKLCEIMKDRYST